jgi:DNA (cytosine-5)-methyltransferase 1
MSRRHQTTFIDLYSGGGLLSAGLVSAGLKPVLAVEMDEAAAASYARNVARCIRVGSVEQVASAPSADVLVAGPPCQGFSSLGRMDPTDHRNELSLAILPWAKRVRAKVILIENVPPFLKSRHWSRLASSLRRMGYEIVTWELDAVDFGTPQDK